MKELFNSLTFYDSVDKQDYNRTGAIIPVYSPRHRLPSFMIPLGSDTIGTIDRIELIDVDGNQYNNDIVFRGAQWANVSYNTFVASGLNITSAINSDGGGDNALITGLQPVKAGDSIRIKGTFNLISGDVQNIVIYEDGAPAAPVALASGDNEIEYTFTTDCAVEISIVNSTFNAGSFSFTGVSINLDLINEHFQTLPEVYASATLGDYIEYKGEALNYLLPLGLYCVKITADNYVYYSDYIMVDNIYPNLVSEFTNSSYETFTKYKTIIKSAVNSSGSGVADSGMFSIKKGESILIIFYLAVANQVPAFSLVSGSLGTISSSVNSAAGINVLTLTSTAAASDVVLRITNSSNSTYNTSEILVIRDYSDNYCRIDFTNTNNVGKLLYEDDLEQTVWLGCVLNNPTHETVTVGEEKDGVFIAEKITTKYSYTIITYCSRAMYSCLLRLPQHDDITITDETGNVYSPAVGNVTIDPPEWVYYNTAKVTIRFNNDDESAFSWTK